MSQPLSSSLPLFDRNLLRAVEKLVPACEREEWLRTWQAELWHMRYRRHNRRSSISDITTGLTFGLVRDALWLRTDSWQRTYRGTPLLCLVSLLGLCLLSTLLALVLEGNWHSLGIYLNGPSRYSILEAPLVVFVGFATASHRHIEQSFTNRVLYWLKRQLFFAAKTLLILFLAFMLSADLCWTIYASFPTTADICQTFCFVILSLVGLRWVFRDQEQRCKQCLHSLATPARVGRPSHNLLEWNGTELVCKQGHGLLSVPEMETSWCQSSQWVALNPDWEQAAGI